MIVVMKLVGCAVSITRILAWVATMIPEYLTHEITCRSCGVSPRCPSIETIFSSRLLMLGYQPIMVFHRSEDNHKPHHDVALYYYHAVGA